MDGNLAMNSHFENMSEKDSNEEFEYYIMIKDYAARLLSEWDGDKYAISKHLREVRLLLRLIKMGQVDIEHQLEFDKMALKMIDEDLYNQNYNHSVKESYYINNICTCKNEDERWECPKNCEMKPKIAQSS